MNEQNSSLSAQLPAVSAPLSAVDLRCAELADRATDYAAACRHWSLTNKSVMEYEVIKLADRIIALRTREAAQAGGL